MRNNDWSNGWWGRTEGDICYNANLVLVGTERVAQMRPARSEAQPEPTSQPEP